jgi:hypothetical protein
MNEPVSPQKTSSPQPPENNSTGAWDQAYKLAQDNGKNGIISNDDVAKFVRNNATLNQKFGSLTDDQIKAKFKNDGASVYEVATALIETSLSQKQTPPQANTPTPPKPPVTIPVPPPTRPPEKTSEAPPPQPQGVKKDFSLNDANTAALQVLYKNIDENGDGKVTLKEDNAAGAKNFSLSDAQTFQKVASLDKNDPTDPKGETISLKEFKAFIQSEANVGFQEVLKKNPNVSSEQFNNALSEQFAIEAQKFLLSDTQRQQFYKQAEGDVLGIGASIKKEGIFTIAEPKLASVSFTQEDIDKFAKIEPRSPFVSPLLYAIKAQGRPLTGEEVKTIVAGVLAAREIVATQKKKEPQATK